MEATQTQAPPKEIYLFKKVSLVDKYNFYEYIATMLDGGVTIIESLTSVSDRVKNGYFREKILELLVYISSWDSLHRAMKKMPDIFTQSESSVVEAGERSGTLIESMLSIAEEYKKLHELKSSVKWALTYPLIIMLFLVAAVIIVMIYVVPSIIPLIEEAWVEKPFATVALIATSNFIANNYVLIILFIILVIISFLFYRSTDRGKRQVDTFLLHIPLLGDVYRNYLLASTASIFGSLMHSGIPIIRSLLLVGKSCNNVVYEELFEWISHRVGQWISLVDSFSAVDPAKRYFPHGFLQMLSVWERTASIDKVCKKLNEQYTREVQYSLNLLTKWIEPLAILIAGLFVLWFAFAIFWAILKLTQTVG